MTDVIEKASREQFVDFYNTWYRPDRMVVIVVGDIDGASIEKQIVDGFSGIAPRSPEPPAVDLGQVPVFTGLKANYHGEPEAPDTRIVLASTVPYTHEPDTAATRLKYLPRMLAVDMLNLRLGILAKKENAPFIRASASIDESFNLYREADIEVVCKAEQWLDAMNVADHEFRRAFMFGFHEDELKQVVSDFRNSLEQAAKTASTRRSDDLAGEVADSLVDREVFTSPQDDLALYGPALDKVTLADCAAAFRAAWSSAGRYVMVAGNLKLVGPQNATNAIVAAAYNRARAAEIKPTGARAEVTWAYSDFGPPGAVASKTHIDDLDITEVVFANGVRLNLKKTDFEANTIHVAARIGTGLLTEPPTEPGLSTVRLPYLLRGRPRQARRGRPPADPGRQDGRRPLQLDDRRVRLRGRHEQGRPCPRIPAADRLDQRPGLPPGGAAHRPQAHRRGLPLLRAHRARAHEPEGSPDPRQRRHPLRAAAEGPDDGAQPGRGEGVARPAARERRPRGARSSATSTSMR